MRKIGLMGGTFDPIHHGHLIAARIAQEACELDEVWFIPSYVPPLKSGAPAVSPEQRATMVRLAIEGEPTFKMMDVELQRQGTSYSFDTVRTLQMTDSDARFFYIIGADRVNDLTQWYNIEQLAQLVEFIGLARPSLSLDMGALPAYLAERVTIVPMPLIEISSTFIRQRMKERQSIRFFVPDRVADYIQRNGLYES